MVSQDFFDYPIDQAQYMMNSNEWTKAVFLREPKERVLSAFLNKYVQGGGRIFAKKCCKKYVKPQSRREECLVHVDKSRKQKRKDDFSYFLSVSQECKNVHWQTQYEIMDAKWWAKINFVGYLHNAAEDSKKLLQGLKSVKDGVSAWDRWGKTWEFNRTGGFMQTYAANYHATNAREKLMQYYKAEDEKFVDKHWAIEWNQPYYHFDRIKLFPDDADKLNKSP